MQNNMTAGSPAKLIFQFTVPVFIGNVFQQFYRPRTALKKSFDLKFFNFPYMLHLKKCKENLFYQNRQIGRAHV